MSLPMFGSSILVLTGLIYNRGNRRDMFAEACEKASKFTRPLVISVRQQDGKVMTDCASFVVINDQGWVITAGHVFDNFVRYQADQNKIKEINEINANRRSDPAAPNNEIKLDKNLLTNHSFWWGWDGVRLTEAYVNRQMDLAIGRLEPFNPEWVKEYPVFIDPDHAVRGRSLCRMGFAFLEIKSDFNEKMNAFCIPKIDVDRAFFPNEGIHTRTIDRGVSKDGGYRMEYIETSSPGLKGQSGCPILDTNGRIYALQVQTSHLPLGFHPIAEYDGNSVVENQFMNLGLGISVRTIRQVLDARGVKYSAEGDESGFRIIG